MSGPYRRVATRFNCHCQSNNVRTSRQPDTGPLSFLGRNTSGPYLPKSQEGGSHCDVLGSDIDLHLELYLRAPPTTSCLALRP
jgi:hypothetical protein